MNSSRTYDVIIWGASGFTGRLVAQYLHNTYGSNGVLKWAMAGRNMEKLERVRTKVADSSVPLIVADSNDRASLEAMVEQTKVLCTTVGPYAKYGSQLVAACVANQTHYCDLAGEVQWMRRMIDTHHDQAKSNGTKIVHTCGFDSIPSDMGVYFIQNQALKLKQQNVVDIKMRVAGMSGGISGGTYASLNGVLEEAYNDQNIAKVLNNPYGLNPHNAQNGTDLPDLKRIKFDPVSKNWIGPFVMAGINTKVVRRSQALNNYAYGKEFSYEEATLCGKGRKGKFKGYLSSIPLVMVTAKPGSILKSIANLLLPKPGQGPNKKQRENGFYNLRFYITLEDGSTAFAKVVGDRDPGYGSTSKMLGEAAVCLAKDNLPQTSGVLTPSIAMGDALLNRLQSNAGLTFTFDL